MTKENKKYKRSEFINNYQLTEEEYHLLPLAARMEYGYKMAGDLLSRVREIGQKIITDEEIPEYLTEFFERNGCEVTRGLELETEEKSTKITRISNTFYPKSASMEVRLNQFMTDLATTKSKIFEDTLRSRLQNELKFLEVGVDFDLEVESPLALLERISTCPITESSLGESQDCIIHFQLKMLIDELDNNDVTIKKPSPHHINYLKIFGYEVIEEEDTITIKQKKKDIVDKNDEMGLFKRFRGEKGCKNNQYQV